MVVTPRRMQRIQRPAPPTPVIDVSEIADLLREGNDLMKMLLKEITKEPTNGVLQLMYPDDGTKAALAAGTTEIDFMAGTVIATDGSVTKMSSSLNRRGKPSMQVAAILADVDIAVQFDSRDKFLIDANTWFEIDDAGFTLIRITTSVLTNVLVMATSSE